MHHSKLRQMSLGGIELECGHQILSARSCYSLVRDNVRLVPQ